VNDFQFGDRDRAHASDFCKSCCRRRYHLRERTERCDQIFSNRFDVAPGQGTKQHEFEQFIVTERFRAGFPKALPQPLAMAVEMWRSRRYTRDRVFRHGTNLA